MANDALRGTARHDDLPRFGRLLYPAVDLIARIPASLQIKLLAGFLGGTLLLVSVAVLAVVVTSRPLRPLVTAITREDRGRQLELDANLLTKYRAVELMTGGATTGADIAQLKRSVADEVAALESSLNQALPPPPNSGSFPTDSDPGFQPDLARIQDANARLMQVDERVAALALDGDKDAAVQLYLQEELPIGEELTSAAQGVWTRARAYVTPFTPGNSSVPGILTAAAVIASVGGLTLALVIGLFLSYAFILPVRRINRVLASIAAGDFNQHVSVANRDEFGSLAEHVNSMSAELARLYSQVRAVSENLQAVVDNALDGILTLDADGTVRTFNPVAQEIFGHTSSEAIGLPIALLVPELAGARGVAGGRRELQGCKKDGSTFPVEVAASAMQVRDERGFIVILRDITERKRAQEELALASDMALEANRAKSSFVANMSHELRTPLNAIIGYSEMLEEEAADLEQDQFVPDLRKIRAAGGHLLGLINAVLDLSKIEAGKMDLYLESFEVEPVVRDVAALIGPLAEKNANELRVTCPPDAGAMHADLTKVRQVLFNLLSNACKFTDHGRVSLEAERTTIDGTEWLLFRVSDSGIGMTSEQVNKLFRPFTQADAAIMRKYGGTGLGLALSQRFSQLMGGEVSVTSELGHGSRFTAKLPVHVREPGAETAPESRPTLMRVPSLHSC